MGASDKSDRAVVNGAQEVSALRASVPSADGSNWTRKVVAVQEEWRFGRYIAFKRGIYGPWYLRNERGIVFVSEHLQAVMAHAQGIEARRAETGTGSVHESAVAESHAPNTSPERRTP